MSTTNRPTSLKSHHLYADCEAATRQIYTDQPGRFITPSSSGNTDMLILYDYDSNFIHVEPMPNRSGASILAAYKRAHTMFSSRGLRPQLQRLDNEASHALQEFMTEQDVDYQLAPPHIHRSNAAERAIRTFKNHFIAGLCSADKDFPLHLWDKLLPQAILTLNLLRGSRINPNLSAWAQVHGAFDFNRTPVAPPGTRVLVHEKPTVRTTWAPHAVDGWYLGPAMHHYRCYRVWIWETSAERITDTLAWLPTRVKMLTANSTEAATAAARDLIHALQNPTHASPLAPASDSQLAALRQLADIFADFTQANTQQEETIAPTIGAPPGFEAITVPTAPPPRVEPVAAPTQAHVTFAEPLPRVEAGPATEQDDEAPLPRVEAPPKNKEPLPSSLKANPRFI